MLRGQTGRFKVTAVGGEEKGVHPGPPPAKPADRPRLRGSTPARRGDSDGVSSLLPDTSLFLYSYVRKEAVLSSQIEGTQSTLSDLLLFELEEIPSVPLDDALEASSYVAALEHGLTRLREGFPLSNRLIRAIHGVLLARGRGSDKDPGEFRRSQNWIGGSRQGNAGFVPPPPELVPECMGALERFLHAEDDRLPVLIRAALAHVQFETIHPFLDGNGRIGRLLITLILCHAGILREPLLYLSLHFKERRDTYYELLDRVRLEGDWEAWLRFFLEGVQAIAESAVLTARRLVALLETDRARIQGLGRAAGSVLRVQAALGARPILSLSAISDRTGLSFPASNAAMERLIDLGMARELTKKRRNRLFVYDPYLAILSEGTDSPL